MIPAKIPGHTNVLGAPAGWDEAKDGPCGALYVRVTRSTEDGSLRFTSAWEPTPEELIRLLRGAKVYLDVVGGQPPVWLEVGPEAEG